MNLVHAARLLHAAQALCVPTGRFAEQPLVLAAELRRTLITNAPAGGCCVEAGSHHETPDFLKSKLLLELKRAHGGDRLEVMVQ